MKVIINNAEMVPTPKKGTIIRFGDCGLFVIGFTLVALMIMGIW